MVSDLMTGTIDAGCGFMDIRYGSAYVQPAALLSRRELLHQHLHRRDHRSDHERYRLGAIPAFQAQEDAIKKAFKAAVGRWQQSD
jgi:hypothetical protein